MCTVIQVIEVSPDWWQLKIKRDGRRLVYFAYSKNVLLNKLKGYYEQ